MTANPRLESAHDRYGVGALIFYFALSSVFLGRALPGDLSTVQIGKGSDPSVYMWFFVWWPYAIAHRINPFVTRLLWAPAGFNLTWTAVGPLAPLVAAPVTLEFGPVVAYNLLSILSPDLAAWTAFLLCRRITHRYAPALAGGYLFGFSAYMLAQSRAHLALVLVFPIPIAVSLALMRFEERIGARAFTLMLAAVLAGQFICSLEILATMTLCGALAVALAIFFTTGEARARIRALIVPIAASYVITAFAMLPYLYFFVQPGFPRVNSPAAYSSDLLNFIIPTPVNAIGNLAPLAALSVRFPGNQLEAGAYVGLPLLAIAILSGIAQWREPLSRTLTVFMLVAAVATLGPRLHIAGATLFGMPWKVMQHLPLINNVLPARLAMYISLGLAIVTSRWLSSPQVAPAVKAVAVALIALFLCPNLSASFWVEPVGTPEFFTASRFSYRQYLLPDEIAVVLPFGLNGHSMLWQAESAMYFRMAGGYTGLTPREFESWPIINAFETSTSLPDAPMQLLAFMAAHETSIVIVDDAHTPRWAPILSAIDPSPLRTGGVALYRASARELARYHGTTALEMERRNNDKRFSALLVAAQTYLAEGHDLADLSPLDVARAGLLPSNWVAEPDVRTRNGLYLGPWEGGKIAIGVVGSYDALRPLIAKYRADASAIFFPFPHKLTDDPPKGDTFMRQLVLVFDRASLAHAASKANLP
jgi:hypothetical protein